MVLLVTDHAKKPVHGELEGRFEAAQEPRGSADARVRPEEEGRYRAVLPPGSWRLKLLQRGASAEVVVDVPTTGAVNVQLGR